MKNALAVLVTLIIMAGSIRAQNVNWRSLRDDQRNIVQLNAGYDYGFTSALSYSRVVDLGKPVLVGLEYSVPMGSDPLDDFKVRLGGQMEIVEMSGFSATVRMQSSFRRYENAMVRIVSFGSDFGLGAGYCAPSWHAGAEFGFDKSVTSHLKHSAVMKSSFPGIRDGWFLPSGGNYYYGVQGGKGIGESVDLSLRLGATNAQGRDENAIIPWYAQLGLGVKF